MLKPRVASAYVLVPCTKFNKSCLSLQVPGNVRFHLINFCCRGDDEKEAQLYGALPTRFQYDKAPPRGTQEDVRDLSHRESYIKYNDDGKDQKYAV